MKLVRLNPNRFLVDCFDLRAADVAVYVIALCLIADRNGAYPYDPRQIALRCRMRVPEAARALGRLINQAKLGTDLDGRFILGPDQIEQWGKAR